MTTSKKTERRRNARLLAFLLGVSIAACSEDEADGPDTSTSEVEGAEPSETDEAGTDEATDVSQATDDDDDATAEPAVAEDASEATDDAPQPANEDDGDVELELSGAFRIQLVAPVQATETIDATPGYVSVLGRVYEFAPPARTGWELLDEQAGCQLFEPKLPFCDPECAGDQVCGAGDTCQDNPTPVDLGKVSLSGLASADGGSIEMTALPPSNTYQPAASAGLEYLPFGPGDAIELSAEGNSELGLGAFTIVGYGVSQLVVDSESQPRFASGEDAEINWEPADADDVSEVELVVDISHHGGQKGELRCSVQDTGSFSIPASLVTGLIDLGVAGFPEVRVVRQTLAHADENLGSIELRVESSRVLYLDIPGIDSCANVGSADECPDGQVCQQDLRCGDG